METLAARRIAPRRIRSAQVRQLRPLYRRQAAAALCTQRRPPAQEHPPCVGAGGTPFSWPTGAAPATGARIASRIRSARVPRQGGQGGIPLASAQGRALCYAGSDSPVRWFHGCIRRAAVPVVTSGGRFDWGHVRAVSRCFFLTY